MTKRDDAKPRARYTLEFKLEAVRLVKAGQEASVTARVLGMPKATLSNWVRASEKGVLQGAGDKPVSAEQMELARLGAELARVKMERDILKKCDGVLCKAISVKYAWIASHKARWPVSVACEVLGVSTSGYFEHQRRRRSGLPSEPGGAGVGNEALLAHIWAIQIDTKGEYGWPRVWKEMRGRGIRVGKDRVQRIMQAHGIKARGKRKFVVTTDSKHELPVAPNLLARDFNPPAPDLVWSGDITYIATDEGWLYLAAVIDLFSRQVLDWIAMHYVWRGQGHYQLALRTRSPPQP